MRAKTSYAYAHYLRARLADTCKGTLTPRTRHIAARVAYYATRPAPPTHMRSMLARHDWQRTTDARWLANYATPRPLQWAIATADARRIGGY